jgi:LysM repeat protein
VWGWLAGITAAGLVYYLVKQHASGSSSSGSGVTGTGSVTPASSVPDYVSQTTINLTEPPSPDDDDTPAAAGGGAKKPPPKKPVKKPVPKKKAPPPTSKKPGDNDPVMSNSYTVKPGDTLDKLAEKYGISRVDLAHANGLGTGAGLRTGQVLHVPGPVRSRAEGGKG